MLSVETQEQLIREDFQISTSCPIVNITRKRLLTLASRPASSAERGVPYDPIVYQAESGSQVAKKPESHPPLQIIIVTVENVDFFAIDRSLDVFERFGVS